MTAISEFLTDADGRTYKLTPSESGGISMEVAAGFQYVDAWTDYTYSSDSWTDFTYTLPTGASITYATLADVNGRTVYLYPHTDGSLIFTTVAPTSGSSWSDYDYGEEITGSGETVTSASVGDEIYESLAALDGSEYYLVPSTDNYYILTSVEPT